MHVSRPSSLLLAGILAVPLAAARATTDPFALLQPTFVLSPEDRRRLDRGEPIARALSTSDAEIAVVAAAPVTVDGDRVVAWMRRIDALKQSSYVLAIGRFSDPPRTDDLSRLALDDEELSDIRACRPADCELKLAASEIARLQATAAQRNGDWRASMQQAFRQVVVDRVAGYLRTGDAAVSGGTTAAVSVRSRTRALIDHSAFLEARLPQFASYLRDRAPRPEPDIETFVYWSKERIARKPVISVTHVAMTRGSRGAPDVIVAGTQILATHYYDASLGVTMLLHGEPGGTNYLVYVNRSEIDVLDGPLSGVTRWFLRRRLRSEATAVLDGLRRRLESGEPPSRSS